MSICADSWIKKMCLEKKMIQPFVAHQVRYFDPKYQHDKPIVSYGLSSYGYDIRVSNQFKVFTNLFNTVVDPKAFDHRSFVDIETDICIIPPNSFALAQSIEYFIIPRDILTLCVGKSTYARCFSGETKVALVDGSSPTFKDLVNRYNQGEKTFLGYGFYGGEYVTQYMTSPRMIGYEDTIIIELNHGESIECTPDHEFICSNGTSIAAEKLNIGDFLLPLCLNCQNGYEMIYNPKNGKWKNTEIAVSEYDSLRKNPIIKNLYSSQSLENNRTTDYHEINANSGDVSHNCCEQYQVMKIINGNKKVPVYCLTAETGNFGLSSGVMVSNCGIIVNVTPFEPEWRGHVTLEISNTTPLPAKIYSNEGIAQVIFFQSQDICEVSYADRDGKYMEQSGVTVPKM